MHAYVVGCVIDSVESGVAYPYFPLHCTLVHWFLTSASSEEISHLIKPVIQSARQFKIVSDFADLYGDEKDIHVHTIRPNKDLLQLHNQLLHALKPVEPTYTIPYMGEHYGPHVTTVDNRAFTPSSSALIQEIYLAQALDPKQIAERIIVKKYSLLPE